MSRYHREGRQHEISINDLNRAWADFPRQNYEDALYDLTLQSGVLQGLNVIPSVVPNLTVTIQTGRGVYRNTVSAQGKLIAVNSDQTLDLSAQVPGSGSVTRYILARPKVASPFGADTLVTPLGAGNTSPFYDPTYTPTAYAPSDGDDCTTANGGLEVSSSLATGDRILLATITLTAGQTQITGSSIDNTTRAYATEFLKEHLDDGTHKIASLIIVGDPGKPGFDTPTVFSQPTVRSAKLAFWKNLATGDIRLEGYVKTLTTDNIPTDVFTLPSGYRPRGQMEFPVASYVPTQIKILASGGVSLAPFTTNAEYNFSVTFRGY